MSLAFIIMTMLLGTSMVIAFVLHPSKEEPAASANLISHHRSIRKDLLKALNMQTEPRLPAGGLDGVREQWKRTYSAIFPGASQPVSDYSQSPDSGDKTCCFMASEVFMKDLGWDSWVIHPLSLTIGQCALCNSSVNTGQCQSSHSADQNPNSQDQVPCCQPTSQETVPIIYMDDSGSVVISSVPLTRSCGLGPANIQPPIEE